MNNDQDNRYGTGFAGGSFSTPNNDDNYGQNSYADDDGYGQDSYASSYGQPNGYTDSGSSYGQPNGYTDNSNGYGQSTDYGTYTGTTGSNRFGSDSSEFDSGLRSSGGMGMNSNTLTNQEPDYDPNEPFYKPENDGYDPNAPLYHPTYTPSASVHTATKTNNTASVVVAIAILLVAVIVGGFLAYKFIFEKKSIREYWESQQGQREVAALKAEFMQKNPDAMDFNITVEDDDKLVYAVKYDMLSISAKDRQTVDVIMEAMKPSLQSELKQITTKNKLSPFKVVFRYLNRNDNVMAEYQIEVE